MTYVLRTVCQLKSKGSSIGSEVGIAGCDVDGIRIWRLAHFYLRRKNVRRVVVDVHEENLKSPCSAGRGVGWKHTTKTASCILLLDRAALHSVLLSTAQSAGWS